MGEETEILMIGEMIVMEEGQGEEMIGTGDQENFYGTLGIAIVERKERIEKEVEAMEEGEMTMMTLMTEEKALEDFLKEMTLDKEEWEDEMKMITPGG